MNPSCRRLPSPVVVKLRAASQRGLARALPDGGAPGIGRAGRIALLATALIGVLWLGASSASALITHNYVCQITGTSPGSSSECNSGGSSVTGGLGGPWGVTVSNGNVWVADPANNTVDEFGSSGAAVSQQTGSGEFSGSYVRSAALNDATQFLYVGDSGPDAVDVFDNTGAFATQWNGSTTPSGSFGSGYVYAAVDNSTGPSAGDVYVTDDRDGVIDKLSAGTLAGSQPTPVAFTGSAAYISGPQITGTPSRSFGDLQGITVDAAGNIYAVDQGNRVVDEFDQTGTFVHQFTGAGSPQGSFGRVTGVALDAASGDVFVVDSGNNAVDQFSNSGIFIGQLTGTATPAGSFNSPLGVAVDQSGDVYVTDAGNRVVDKFGPDVVVPDVTTGQATNRNSTSATLNGTVNPDGTTITDCRFEYGTDTSYGQSAPCVSSPSASSPAGVSATVSNLQPLTTYHFRLLAGNANGANDGADETFITPAAPAVDGESVSGVGRSAATLNAQINPDAADTMYHFEYGTTTAYGRSVPIPDAAAGSGTSDDAVSQPIQGLQPGTTYHYRVTATNSQGATDGSDQTLSTYQTSAPQSCPNAVLRTGPVANLPDCRAYEMVTPVDKNGGQVGFDPSGGISNNGIPYASTPDGGEVTYSSFTAFPGSQGAQPTDQYISMRGPDGWSTRPITPSYTAPNRPEQEDPYWWFSPDLSMALVRQADPPLAAGAPAGFENVYTRNDGTGTFTPLTPVAPTGFGSFYDAWPAGASADFSHVIFTALGALTPESPPSANAYTNAGDNLYEWVRGQLGLVSQIPTPPATSCSGQACTPAIPNAGTGFGKGSFGVYNIDVQNAISADGSKVFWTYDNPVTGGTELFARVDATTTVQIPGSYLDASVDGSKVLTDTGGLSIYDVATGTLTDLTGALGSANFVGASDDLSRIYYTVGGVVSGGGTAPDFPLYVWDNGTIKLIATLSTDDLIDWQNPHVGDILPLTGRTATVTPDGEHLAFVSDLSLTGYDNADATPGATCSHAPVGGNPPTPDCYEVYLYDAGSGQLTCASCNPTGERPLGQSFLAPDWTTDTTPPEVLTNDGNRLFFDSTDALSPYATNGKQNVYEWERNGNGSCTSSPGCVYLISTGTSSDDSFFVAASASGNDAFFYTRQQLAPQDVDQSNDIYDARVGGGFPQPTPAAPPCTGDACRAPGNVSPPLEIAASVTFIGSGNTTGRSTSAAARASVITRAVRGTTFMVAVRVPATGRITITGIGIRAITRSVNAAGAYRLRVALMPAMRRVLRQRHRLQLTIHVGFTHTGSGATTATTRLTVKA